MELTEILLTVFLGVLLVGTVKYVLTLEADKTRLIAERDKWQNIAQVALNPRAAWFPQNQPGISSSIRAEMRKQPPDYQEFKPFKVGKKWRDIRAKLEDTLNTKAKKSEQLAKEIESIQKGEHGLTETA